MLENSVELLLYYDDQLDIADHVQVKRHHFDSMRVQFDDKLYSILSSHSFCAPTLPAALIQWLQRHSTIEQQIRLLRALQTAQILSIPHGNLKDYDRNESSVGKSSVWVDTTQCAPECFHVHDAD